MLSDIECLNSRRFELRIIYRFDRSHQSILRPVRVTRASGHFCFYFLNSAHVETRFPRGLTAYTKPDRTQSGSDALSIHNLIVSLAMIIK